MVKLNLILQSCCANVFISNDFLCSEAILNEFCTALIINLKLYILVLLCENHTKFLQTQFNII